MRRTPKRHPIYTPSIDASHFHLFHQSPMPGLTTPQRRSRERRTKLAIHEWHAYGKERFGSMQQCALIHGIQQSTFSRRLRETTQSYEQAQRPSELLLGAMKNALVSHLIFMANRGFPATIKTIQSTAQELLQKAGRPTYIGKQWAYRFVRREERLKSKYSRSLDAVRAAKNNNPESLQGWFDLLKHTVEAYQITPERTYNMDETGFMTSVITASTKVIVEAVVKEPHARKMPSKASITQPGNREWTTVIQAIGAAGNLVDPFIIIKGASITRSFAANIRSALPISDFPHAAVACTENGWSDASIAVAWLRGFIEQTAPPRDANGVMPYRLLIVDGHSSHASLDFIGLAEQHRVIVLCFPAHATHLLQPLDVGCFASLKKEYCELLMTEQRAQSTNRDDFIHLYAEAQKVLTPALIQSSFKSTGIWPFNPAKVMTRP
jgi:hypothetical protein